MGNLESTEGGPGEPPSVPLLLPPGKTPMPEPCELEERFALVLVRRAPLPSRRTPPPAGSRPPPQPRQRLTRLRSSERPIGGPQAPDLPEVQTPPRFPQASRSAAGIPFPGPRWWDDFGSRWVPSPN